MNVRTTTSRDGLDAPEGYHWMASTEDSLDWRLQNHGRCRAGASPSQKACGRPAVAALNRGYGLTRDWWWAYCERHLYGRWIENGQLWHWVLRPVKDEP